MELAATSGNDFQLARSRARIDRGPSVAKPDDLSLAKKISLL